MRKGRGVVSFLRLGEPGPGPGPAGRERGEEKLVASVGASRVCRAWSETLPASSGGGFTVK